MDPIVKKWLRETGTAHCTVGHDLQVPEIGVAELLRDRAALRARVRELEEALKDLFAAESTSAFEITGTDDNGHPLNALGVARKEARKVLKGGGS